MQESPPKPYEHLRGVWRTVEENSTDQRSAQSTIHPRNRRTRAARIQLSKRDQTIKSIQTTRMGQIWRPNPTRTMDIDPSIGQIRHRQDSMCNFDHANENASSSIEIDRISAAFHRTKGFSNPMAAIDHPRRIKMAKTSGTELMTRTNR